MCMCTPPSKCTPLNIINVMYCMLNLGLSAFEDFRVALLNATYNEATRALTFEQPMPWKPRHKSLYVREDYVSIVDCILRENRDILITGNPGTGKSQCAVYALYRALQVSKVVLYHRSVDGIIILFKQGESVKVFKPTDTMPSEHYDSNTLYFYDAGTRSRPQIPFGISRKIAFSSPSRENTSDFIKEGVIELNMPIWDLDELETAHMLEQYKNVIPTQSVSARYDQFGGIVRYVLHPEKEVNTYLRRLNGHILRCEMRDLITLGSTGDLDDATHMLFHRQTVPGSDYREYMIQFASPYVRDRVLDAIDDNSFTDMIAFVNQDRFDACVSSLQGVLFENVAHRLLPKEGKYEVRKLLDRSESNVEFGDRSESNVEFGEADRVVFTRTDMSDINMGGFQSSVYLQPKVQNFPAADSLRPPDCIFQCTKSSKHNINVAGLKRIIAKLQQHTDYSSGMRFKFYFVVSKKVFDSSSFVRRQNYTNQHNHVSSETFPDVDQYVLNLGI